jgi:4-amino-4-deoxy-L-arabinose transferase-like glycosyltransferase
MRTWQPRTLTGVAFLLAAVLFFARLGDLPLIDPDEGRNAEVAREMAESGAWVVPTFNAIPYLDKPALYFHAVALSFRAFGRSETTARLPSALSAAALVVMMFVFCRRVYGERTAALTVLVLATTPLVIGFARLVIFDMPLTFFVSAAILAGHLAEEDPGPARRRWLLIGAASSAIATLIKGPVGFLVPAAVLAVLHLVERRPRAILRMLAPVNLLVFLALVLPWFVALVVEHPDFLHYGLSRRPRAATSPRHSDGASPCTTTGRSCCSSSSRGACFCPRPRWRPGGTAPAGRGPTASSSCGQWSWWCSSRARSPSARATSSRASWRSRS